MEGQLRLCMYRRASMLNEDRGSKIMAPRYAEMELETNMRLLGEDHSMMIEGAKAVAGNRFVTLKRRVFGRKTAKFCGQSVSCL